MLLSNTISTELSLLDAGIIALLGYAVVFFGLILLMLVVMIMSKAFTTRKSENPGKTEQPPAPSAPVSVPASAPAPVPAPAAGQPAPGSAGQLKLHDVPPKTAAMLMAIVAHKTGKPLNELRFISIKEVK